MMKARSAWAVSSELVRFDSRHVRMPHLMAVQGDGTEQIQVSILTSHGPGANDVKHDQLLDSALSTIDIFVNE